MALPPFSSGFQDIVGWGMVLGVILYLWEPRNYIWHNSA